MTEIDPRLIRVHVDTVRCNRRGEYLVVLSDPKFTQSGDAIRSPDTWEVTWDRWVDARGNLASLK